MDKSMIALWMMVIFSTLTAFAMWVGMIMMLIAIARTVKEKKKEDTQVEAAIMHATEELKQMSSKLEQVKQARPHMNEGEYIKDVLSK